MHRKTELRITTLLLDNSGICDICMVKPDNDRILVYTNTILYSVYVKMLTSGDLHREKLYSIKVNRYCGAKICELTKLKFVPKYAMVVCKECYDEYIGEFLRNYER